MTNSTEGIEIVSPSRHVESETHSNSIGSCARIVPAVLIRNAIKRYGSGKRSSPVLDGLHMNVKQGTIYGLLGASGCGKTTLLSCLVGRRRLDSGNMLVFGHEPGSEESGIPGPRVGYMPQDLALHGYFTIKETLYYFGRIYNLKADFVHAQLEFLSKLLDLPPGDRYVKTLSGGQQRRVSFAVALFHEPELLILDEPTVGVDPLLRHSIWNHLVRQSVDHGRTVIVTTHYIEEARQANKIGLMRSGRLLTEESPENLLRMYGLSSLEDVFLKLCVKDNGITPSDGATISNAAGHALDQTQEGRRNGLSDDCIQQLESFEICNDHGHQSAGPFPVASFKNVVHKPGTSSMNDTSETSSAVLFTGSCSSTISSSSRNRNFTRPLFSSHRLIALVRKNYLHTFRNVGMFVFIYLLPLIQATVFNLTLGHEPTGLMVGIVNDEVDPSEGLLCNYTTACSYSMLSCRYLRYIRDNIVQVPYENLTEALEAGRSGEVWGVIHFGHNFTEEFEKRQVDGDSATLENIIRSRISINMDSSNHLIYTYIERWILEAFENFFKDFMRSCEHEPEAGYIPLEFMEPVYGQKETQFTEFMAPAFTVLIVYFMGVSLTSGVFISERQQGILDRCMVAGVQMTEILMSHLVNQFTAMIGQTALVFICMLLIFNIPCHGSLTLAIFITFLQSFVGMSFGLLIATVCDSEIGALLISQASFLPFTVICGVSWPIEGMSFYLRFVAYSMPMTYAIESLRCVFTRGWGMEQPDVYVGIIISIVWIFALLATCVIVLRARKYAG
ncbi:ABC protein [Daphnia sinensis]|uniref:ABC protein n=1 Tax=Daphnia sinensis TaxID=1820382 RepID=A0AAD5PQ80_9CRUS|nr:ABC protein [Daphnia sinensis]